MRRLAAAVALVAVVLFGGAQAAFAADLVIRDVDTSGYPTVRMSAQATGTTPDLAHFILRENGRVVPQFDVLPLAKTDVKVGVVLAVDVSGSMKANGALDQAKAAARQFVLQKLPTQEIAVVTFGSAVAVPQGFTADRATLVKAIDGLTAAGETALWDGVRQAMSLLHARGDLQPNLLLLTDGKDTSSSGTFEQARGDVVSTHAAVYAVGLQGADFDPRSLQALADAAHGQYTPASDPRALTGLYRDVQKSILNQYEVRYASKAKGKIDVELDVDGLTATARNVDTGRSAEPVVKPTKPVVVKPPPTSKLFRGHLGLVLVILLVLAAAGLLAYAVVLMAMRSESSLDLVLQHYDDEVYGDDDDQLGSMAQTAAVKRAVDVTAKFAARRGVLDWLDAALERADIPLRPAETLFFYMAGAFVFTLLGLVVKGIFGALVALAVAAVLPRATLSFLARRRQRKFTSQLPDTLQLLAGSLRAGYSLLQGVEAVSQEVDDPMGAELRRVIIEAQLGRPLEDALNDCAQRMESLDFDWAVMAIRVQREVGGNLSELLMTVAETMVERERLRREIQALTAEGRMSAYVLGLLPIGLGIVMYVVNPGYIGVLFSHSLGQVMLGISGSLAVAGFFWMNRMIKIEV